MLVSMLSLKGLDRCGHSAPEKLASSLQEALVPELLHTCRWLCLSIEAWGIPRRLLTWARSGRDGHDVRGSGVEGTPTVSELLGPPLVCRGELVLGAG